MSPLSAFESPLTYTFPSLNLSELKEKVLQFDPVRYAKTRNFIHGGVSELSPYISRGVISTRWVYETLISAGHTPKLMEKFVQELAWRDYWQYRCLSEPHRIEVQQLKVISESRSGIPNAVLDAQTQIDSINHGVKQLYETGYMHNHVRMYTASLVCNVAQCHWLYPAQWMYYHLLDADWASNAFSWLWVNGKMNGKVYYANQENINYYTKSQQRHTYLDIDYAEFPHMAIPEELTSLSIPELTTNLPKTDPLNTPIHETCFIYSIYNLDPQWHLHEQGKRILLLEPSHFKHYPISDKNLAWIIRLAEKLIPDLQVIVAEWNNIKPYLLGKVFVKEHPFNSVDGIIESRNWLCPVTGHFNSFFAYWKKAEKHLMR